MHGRDTEAAVEIVLVYLLESLEYLRDHAVRKMGDCRGTNLTAECQEKGYLVHEEDIGRQKNFLVEFQQLRGDSYKILGHWSRLAPSGLSFQRRNVLPPDFVGDIDVLDRNRAVLDLVALNHPFEICQGWVAQRCIQCSGGFCILYLPLRETLLVLGKHGSVKVNTAEKLPETKEEETTVEQDPDEAQQKDSAEETLIETAEEPKKDEPVDDGLQLDPDEEDDLGEEEEVLTLRNSGMS